MFCAGFFHTRKKFKNFSKEVIKSHLSFPIWCGKRDKHFSNHSGKGVRLMKPSDFQKTVQCRFESCLKKVVRHVVKDYQQGLKRRKDKEIPFCELPEIVVEKLAGSPLQHDGQLSSNNFQNGIEQFFGSQTVSSISPPFRYDMKCVYPSFRTI